MKSFELLEVAIIVVIKPLFKLLQKVIITFIHDVNNHTWLKIANIYASLFVTHFNSTSFDGYSCWMNINSDVISACIIAPKQEKIIKATKKIMWW